MLHEITGLRGITGLSYVESPPSSRIGVKRPDISQSEPWGNSLGLFFHVNKEPGSIYSRSLFYHTTSRGKVDLGLFFSILLKVRSFHAFLSLKSRPVLKRRSFHDRGKGAFFT